jgi:hypothetical protein
MSHDIRISARFRKEPDYGRLARALLQFLEDQAAAERTDNDPQSQAQDETPASGPIAEDDSAAEAQP